MLKSKIKNLKNSGFSLIELLVALAVFTLIIGGVTLFSIRTIQAHTRSQAMQTAIENAQFAIEGLNKKIRTSSNIKAVYNWNSSNTRILVKDNVDGVNYCYNISGGKLTVKRNSTSINDCAGTDLVGSPANISVTGRFYVKETDEDNVSTAARKRGMVTTVITIAYNPAVSDPYQKDSFTIQSTVSLRDYGMND